MTVAMFQKRVGPEHDPVWQDIKVPPEIESVAQLKKSLSDNGVVGTYKVLEQDMRENYVGYFTFEVRRVQTYECVDL